MRESRWQQFDFIIIACVVLLVALGIAMIHSATCGSPCGGLLPPSGFALRQSVFAVLGVGALLVVSLLDYRFYRAYAYHILGIGLILLTLVLVIGRGGTDQDYGARRWIPLGLFDLQPSEVAKLAITAALARLFSDKQEGPLSLRRLLCSIAIIVPAAVLVFAEPDLGTTISFVFIWLVLVCFAGIRRRHALGLAVGGLASLPLVWLAMRDYQRERLATFIGTLVDVEHAAFDDGYNILQARISIGSGGLFGRGYLEGTQTQLDYLRVKQSDFIFSSLAEELGFLGALALFVLFVVLIFRIVRAADRSRDDFGRLLGLGIGAMVLFQAVANLGANLTLLPVTGIPLPFISYGGTSLLTNLVALGIVQSILLNRLKYRF